MVPVIHSEKAGVGKTRTSYVYVYGVIPVVYDEPRYALGVTSVGPHQTIVVVTIFCRVAKLSAFNGFSDHRRSDLESTLPAISRPRTVFERIYKILDYGYGDSNGHDVYSNVVEWRLSSKNSLQFFQSCFDLPDTFFGRHPSLKQGFVDGQERWP